MPTARLLPVVLVVTLAVAAPARADPRLVARSEAVGNPVFVGDDLVYPALNRRGIVELRLVRRRGGQRVIARLGRLRGVEDSPVVLAGSASHLAVAVADQPPGGGPVRETVRAGPLGGPLREIPSLRCSNTPGDQPIALDGTRLAYVRETCRGRTSVGAVVVRDLATGEETAGIPTSGVDVALAGRYVVYHDLWDEHALHVYDLERSQVAYGVRPRSIWGFAVQDDGKLAVSSFGDSVCEGYLWWFSAADPNEHEVRPGCSQAPPLVMRGDRVAHVLNGKPRVSDLRGRGRTVRPRGDIVPGIAFDGKRLAFSTRGCSPDTGAVWIDALTGRNARPRPARRCRVTLPRGPLRLDRRNRVSVRLSCPTGCRGFVRVESARGRRLGGQADFLLLAGQAKRIPIRVRQPSRLLGGRRSATVRLSASVDQADDRSLPVDVSRSVALRR